jgi:mannose-6-phosphate isomerase class I
MARAVSRGDARVLDELARSLIRPERDNLVPRPWGGSWIRRFKGIPLAEQATEPYGEAFEISAFAADPEASRFPSRIRFADDSILGLPDLLDAHAEAILGRAFVRRYGPHFPLLPKTLSVRELLSVQGHPPGHTEVYIIIDAEPGASLRLGFSRDIDAAEMVPALSRGLEQQRALADLLGKVAGAEMLQSRVRPWFSDRDTDDAALRQWLAAMGVDESAQRQALALLGDLKALYWQMLDAMNEIAVHPGQVIYNATPERLLSRERPEASAEVHALGNPEGKEILALEIRRPGPTFRAWDNVRFPLRDVDVEAAIGALNLRATRPEEFRRERIAVAGRARTHVSVDSDYFRVEHLLPEAGLPVDVPAAGPHSLHCLSGSVAVFDSRGRPIGTLGQGESALVPVGVGAYRVEAESPADVVRVTLPED